MRRKIKVMELQHGGLLFMKITYPNHAPRHLRPDKNHLDFKRNHYLRMQKKHVYKPAHEASCYCLVI